MAKSHALVTASSNEPLDLMDVKDHLRINRGETADDDMLTRLIKVARRQVENYTGRKLMTQTWDLYFDSWPTTKAYIELPYAPISSIGSTCVTYVTSTAGTIKWSSTEWDLDNKALPNRLSLVDDYDWPSDYTLSQNSPITVRAMIGYGTNSSDVPDEIKQAMLMIISRLYEYREPYVTGTIIQKVPDDIVRGLLTDYKVWG